MRLEVLRIGGRFSGHRPGVHDALMVAGVPGGRREPCTSENFTGLGDCRTARVSGDTRDFAGSDLTPGP